MLANISEILALVKHNRHYFSETLKSIHVCKLNPNNSQSFLSNTKETRAQWKICYFVQCTSLQRIGIAKDHNNVNRTISK
jgi:hypothetical protein